MRANWHNRHNTYVSGHPVFSVASLFFLTNHLIFRKKMSKVTKYENFQKSRKSHFHVLSRIRMTVTALILAGF